MLDVHLRRGEWELSLLVFWRNMTMSKVRTYLVDRRVQPPRFEYEVEVEEVDGSCPQLLRYAGDFWVLWSTALGYCKVVPVVLPLSRGKAVRTDGEVGSGLTPG